MFKQFILAITGAGLLALAGLANAAPGFYAEGQLGYGGMYTKHYHENATVNDVSRLGFAGRVALGYLIQPANTKFNYGVEAGWGTYVHNEYNTTTGNVNREYKGYHYDALGVIGYDFAPKWMGFAKAGAAFVLQNFRRNTAVLNIDSHKFEPELAAGMEYRLNRKLDLNVTYSYIWGNTPDPLSSANNQISKVASVRTVLLGLCYHFV